MEAGRSRFAATVQPASARQREIGWVKPAKGAFPSRLVIRHEWPNKALERVAEASQAKRRSPEIKLKLCAQSGPLSQTSGAELDASLSASAAKALLSRNSTPELAWRLGPAKAENENSEAA